MKPINQIIAEGKRLCESWDGKHDSEHHFELSVYHSHEYMKLLYKTLERAIEVIKFYSDSDNWGSDRKDWSKYLIMVSDSDKGDGSFMVSETVDDSGVGGKRAREFLASIEKRGEE